jgi:rhodanese-related sulfurtransferase
MTKEEFIAVVATDQPEVPAYFPVSASRNLAGSASLDELQKPKELSSAEIDDFEGIVVDVRKNFEYGAGHVANSINIGLGGQFATWAGTLIPIGTPVALVAETKEQIDEAFMRLARVGIETATGFVLIGKYLGDKKSVQQAPVEVVCNRTDSGEVQFVDVRKIAEHSNGHAAQTVNIPLDKLTRELDRLDPEKPTYVICQSGYRSSIGTSILENAGFKQICNVTGGTKAWIDASLPTEVSSTACAAS